MDLTQQQKRVRREIERIYPQLLINCEKTCTTNFQRWGHDILALCIEMFLSKEIETQIKVIEDGKLENYITFMIGLQLKSSSSRFYHHYRKPVDKIREFFPNYAYKGQNVSFPEPFQDEQDPVITCLLKVKEELPPFEKMVLDRHMINKEKFIDLSQEYQIPYFQFKLAKDKVKKLMTQKCKSFL